jgi:hypothetical protein
MEGQPSHFRPDRSVSQWIDPDAKGAELVGTDSKKLYYVQLADVALQGVQENHSTGRKQELHQRRIVWNRVLKSQNLPLCYEHHVEMRVRHIHPGAGKATVCPERNCPVSYNSRQGYSIIIGRRETEGNMIPRVSCPRDGRLMYLSQVKPEKRSFRLWRCPQCGESYTNWDLL